VYLKTKNLWKCLHGVAFITGPTQLFKVQTAFFPSRVQVQVLQSLAKVSPGVQEKVSKILAKLENVLDFF
jgi:hypothetical protein